MNTKIIAGVLTILLLLGVFWYIATDGDITKEDTTETAEHSDNLTSNEVSPAAVVDRVQANEDLILLDVRTPAEYEALHLENALLLPVKELSAKTLEDVGLGEDMKDAEIIIYGRSGTRSQTAYNVMQSLGYTNISSVAGGMVHWEEDGYPLTEIGPYSGVTYESGVTATEKSTVGSKVSVDRTLHDFGVVPQSGGTVETTFELTNTGSQVLEIGTLSTSCSCTTATIENTSLAPNESTILTVVLDPDLHPEPLDVFKRTVFIPTNDPDNPELEVSIQLDIAEGE